MPQLHWSTIQDGHAHVDCGCAILRVRHNGRNGADEAWIPSVQFSGSDEEDLERGDTEFAAKDIAERYMHVPEVTCRYGTYGKRGPAVFTWRVQVTGDPAGGICRRVAEFAVVLWYPRLPSPASMLIGVHATELGARRVFRATCRDRRVSLPLPKAMAVAIVVPKSLPYVV